MELSESGWSFDGVFIRGQEDALHLAAVLSVGAEQHQRAPFVDNAILRRVRCCDLDLVAFTSDDKRLHQRGPHAGFFQQIHDGGAAFHLIGIETRTQRGAHHNLGIIRIAADPVVFDIGMNAQHNRQHQQNRQRCLDAEMVKKMALPAQMRHSFFDAGHPNASGHSASLLLCHDCLII